jgi:glycosyltransferase involved in cell wall biosynthesis
MTVQSSALTGMTAGQGGPAVAVLSQLYPHGGQPGAGLFIRERMTRVARHLPLVVVSPVPWFPLQGFVRRFRPHFRPPAPRYEERDGVLTVCPRYLSVPGVLKGLDGLFMALGALRTLRRLQREGRAEVIDAHFAYPDGYAAGLLGRWLRLPVTVTLRGTEARLVRSYRGRRRVAAALRRASRIFTVSDSLRRVALEVGAEPERVVVVPNGVDTERFYPVDRDQARKALGISSDAQVLISVGTLVERKGFHRVIELLPELRERFPELVYLVVGGSGPEGDMGPELRRQAQELGVAEAVQFLGVMAPDELREPLSAADVFVLATRNEGWANVFLEAMACGLPVVTTDVGGNREVVASAALGHVVPFGDSEALTAAIKESLGSHWDHQAILEHATGCRWEDRVSTLVAEFSRLSGGLNEDHQAAEPEAGTRPRDQGGEFGPGSSP